MSDNKKVSGTNENNINKSKKSYEELSNMLKSLNTINDNINYSTDINKFNNDCSKLIKFIKETISDNNFHALYIQRKKNIIIYGKYIQGIKANMDIIEMISNEDLKNIYELLKIEFLPYFVSGCKHTFAVGWSLRPKIGENIIINIYSDIPSDSNWFYEEALKEINQNHQRTK